MTDELAYCNPKVTCVVEANLETVWKILKQWSTFYWLDTVEGQPCEIQPHEGSENAVGSSRTVQIGNSLMFERLVAMDDETHTLKWRTMAHEDSVTPFHQASYINSLISLNFREITHNNFTFCEWEVAFYTEQNYALDMHNALEAWMYGAFETLQRHVLTENPTVDKRRRTHKIPQAPYPSYPENPQARFADLHISPGMSQQYGIPTHDQMRQVPRGMAAPVGPDPRLQKPGKPMGARPQAPLVGASQPTMQQWQAQSQAGRQPRMVHPNLNQSGHDYAPSQHPAYTQQRQRAHMVGSNYAPSLTSNRSGSLDSLNLHTSTAGHNPRQPPRGTSQLHSDVLYSNRQAADIGYDPIPQDARQSWEHPATGHHQGLSAPMGAPASAFYDQGEVYGQRTSRSSNRSRTQGMAPQMPMRGSR